jgi:hypothetical protein
MQSIIWSLGLIAASVLLHAFTIAALDLVLELGRRRIVRRHRHLPPLFSLVVATIAMAMLVAHAITVILWAIVYWWLGAIGSFADAVYFSLDSYTTRGASGLVIGAPWRMMGAMEAVDGVLLFGLTTAFLFAVMQVWWPIWMARRYGLDADGVDHGA